jgi:DUF4097 and DUF4098 domain-containing protein YvlB
MKQLFITTVLGLACWGLAPAQTDSAVTRDGAYWVRTLQGAIDTSASDRLRVETSGNVTLRGEPAPQGAYTITLRVKAGSAREAETQLERISVKTGSEGGWTYLKVGPPWGDRVSATLSVTASKALRQVKVMTDGGNVQASDWNGDVQARTAGGQMAVDRIGGRAEVETGGGDIQVGTVNGPLRGSSGGGGIRVESACAEMTLETAGGEIFVHQVKGPVQASTGGGNIRIEHAASTVMARTAGGLIQVQEAEGPVTAESSGGAIQVSSTNGVRCESTGGAIRLRNMAGPVRAFANSGSIMAELGAGRDSSGKGLADSILSTNAGDITVLIPSNLALTVEATNESGGSGRINSDFAELRPRGSRSSDFGPVVAKGALNGGGPLLRINVTGGTIYLRRMK